MRDDRAPWGEHGFRIAHVEVRDLAWLPLEFICMRMREIDKTEIFGNLPTENPLHVTAMLMDAVARQGVGWVSIVNGQPAAWLALFEQWKGNWQVSMGGTDAFSAGVLQLIPYWHRGVRYALAHGCHRIEAKSHASHIDGRAMAIRFGAQIEAVLDAYGKDRMPYYQLAWTNKWLQDAAREVYVDGCAQDSQARHDGEASLI